MGNAYIDSSLLDKAIHFATDAHANTERRGKGFPYIVHPLEAVSIATVLTSDQRILAAAALHDIVEDTEITIDDIKNEFGVEVALLVKAETDIKIDDQPEESSWRLRKSIAIKRIAASDYNAKIVALADKLSNMRAIARDYRIMGDELWDRFHAPGGKADHEWHYRGLASSLEALSGTEPYEEFITLITQVFGKE